MEVTLRVLIGLGFGLLLIMLRLDAERFGAAEYVDAGAESTMRGLWRRTSWYVLGLAMIVAVALVHPSPSDLLLRIGDRGDVVGFGLAFAVLGALQAIGFAWLVYRRLRLPPAWAYPTVLLNSVTTAVIDEAAFRGIFLAYLLGSGMGDVPAIVIQGLVYALATRLGAPGRPAYLFLVFLVVGLVAGWSATVTWGIGAAIVGHAVTRFAVLVCHVYAGEAPSPDRDAGEGGDLPPRRAWAAAAPGDADSVEV